MIPHPEDTIVAVSSAPGPGRRAIIRIDGPKALEVATTPWRPTVKRSLAESHRLVTPGELSLSGVHARLPADAYYFRAPRSYTGQDLIEFHLVSSPPLVERLIADLLAAGARPAQPGEFTLRAFLNGKKDLTRAEAVLAVIEAGTPDELARALDQLAGGLARPLDALRDDLLSLLADVEAGLDFVDEDIEFVTAPEQRRRIDAGLAQLTRLQRQLDDRTVSGRPIRVALVGEPNAGKSSLFNALVGPAGLALVSETAGTTRDYLSRLIDVDGVPVELLDTAGWQTSTDTIEEQAQRLGRDQADRADLVLWCVPADAAPSDPPAFPDPSAVIRVRTKSDLATAPRFGFVDASTVAPDGSAALRSQLAERVRSASRSAMAPSQSRCRHHVESSLASLHRARNHVIGGDPQELLALELRTALDSLGEMVGAIYTNDLLDRIFSRFCIGK